MINLLLVEDHELLRNILTDELNQTGFTVSAYESAEEVVENTINSWQLALLDVNLPGEKGTELAARLRRSHPRMGIVVLTVVKELTEKVNAYQAGADVYLTKPIDIEELVCVLTALAKRLDLALPANARCYQLYSEGRLLTSSAGASVRLTLDETQLLSSLVVAKDQQLETWQIMSLLNKTEQEKSSVEVMISRLRKKLTDLTQDKKVLESLRQKGYRLNLDVQVL